MLLQTAAPLLIPLAVICAPGDAVDPGEELARLRFEAKVLRSLPLAGASPQVRQALLRGFEERIRGIDAEFLGRWSPEQKRTLYEEVYSRDVLGALRADGVVDRQAEIASRLGIQNPEAAVDELVGILGKGAAADREQIRRHAGALPGSLTPAAAGRLLRAVAAWVGTWKIPDRPDGTTAQDLGLLLEMAKRMAGPEGPSLQRDLSAAAWKFLDSLAGRFTGGGGALEVRTLLLAEIGPLLEAIRLSDLTPAELKEGPKFSGRLGLSPVRGAEGQFQLGEVRYFEARGGLGEIAGTVRWTGRKTEWAYALSRSGGTNFGLCLIYREADTAHVRALVIKSPEESGKEVRPPWPARFQEGRIFLYHPSNLSTGYFLVRRPWTVCEAVRRLDRLRTEGAPPGIFEAAGALRDRSNLGELEALAPGTATDAGAIEKAASLCSSSPPAAGAAALSITLPVPADAPSQAVLDLLGRMLEPGEGFIDESLSRVLQYLEPKDAPEGLAASLRRAGNRPSPPAPPPGAADVRIQVFTVQSIRLE